MATSRNKKSHGVKKPFVESLDIPLAYNRIKLTLVARDPHWIYAYWEIPYSSVDELKSRIGSLDGAARILRLYDVSCIDFNGTNANRQFDIDVGANSDNWYVNLWNDNASYCAEIGYRFNDGRFFALTRSNFVTTPRINSSNRREEIWMKAEGFKPAAPYVIADVKKNQRTGTPGNRPNRRRRITLTEEDVAEYYSNISPLLKDVISQRLARRLTRRGMLKRLGLDFSLTGSDTCSAIAGRFSKKTFLGASEYGGASEAFPGASEQSPARKFFFEIGTELIVYGRTEPDAKVFWGDKKIELRPDGTFDMRLALPDGKIPLGFTAISADDAEKREIITAAEREKTRYV
ncbi:MAG: DUF4912 domain-containing protein [Candidatus Omnitrophota bacterium]